jgi:hypothetical protein
MATSTGEPKKGKTDWRDQKDGPFANFVRTADFWRRTVGIYASYKGTQLREAAMRAFGAKDEEVKSMWVSQHQYAGKAMYELCVDLRGFYLKVSGCNILVECRECLLHCFCCFMAPGHILCAGAQVGSQR